MHEFETPRPITLSLRLPSGAAEVTAEERDTATVEIKALDGSDISEQAAQRCTVEMDGDTLVVHAPERETWLMRRSPKLRMTVRVPLGTAVRAKVASADLRTRGTIGDTEIASASGDVWIEAADGDVSASTASGGLRVDRVAGSLSARTASGGMAIGSVDGDTSVHSASGDVRVGDAGGSVHSTTASGDLEVGRVVGGTVRAKSASGDVSIGVAAGTGVWLDLSTVSGRTYSELTMAGGGQPGGAGYAHDHEDARELGRELGEVGRELGEAGREFAREMRQFSRDLTRDMTGRGFPFTDNPRGGSFPPPPPAPPAPPVPPTPPVPPSAGAYDESGEPAAANPGATLTLQVRTMSGDITVRRVAPVEGARTEAA